METSSVTARLRRPFAYDSDNLPEDLDEEEQETLIETLTTQNTAQNATYARILTLLPLVAAQPYILNLASLPPLPRLLSISCLLVTAYLTYILPPTETGFPALNARQGADGGSRGGRGVGNDGGRGRGTRGGDPFSDVAELSPARRYLPYLNLSLAVLISLLSLVEGRGWPALIQGCLPALIYGVVFAAKLVMADVDPGELRGLKYDYKGA
ncbi:uncharacterized protein DNG_06563 [Cephalotrichum gorgonifer]|uniref:Uncharacterized protein n=1 Tax=Cephalotrichum gorgonifer TaxID=2041049 RepID=A0AAE8N2Z2_9PEZI|nr:uncharacterized protein DNG_06563 [Cephalotrichum gorgonifer]